MNQTWEFAYDKMIGHEQGFTDDPLDNGNKLPDGRPGCTNWGVTQAAWEEHIGRQVTHDEMRALTPEIVKPFYKNTYWDKVRADELPLGVDYAVFDTCVNSGPGRAAMLLQACVNATQDGAIGPRTLAAVRENNAELLIKDYSKRRVEFMKSLPSWQRFGNGWERRVKEVEAAALALLPLAT